jgi:hypothetical protein
VFESRFAEESIWVEEREKVTLDGECWVMRSFVFCTLCNILLVLLWEEMDELGGVCGTRAKCEKCILTFNRST